jgi:plastocyanin
MAMYAMATPYYKRVRFVAGAMAGGSQAVTDAQFDEILRDRRPMTIAGIGIVGLLVILYLMVLKPTLGFSTTAEGPPVAGGSVEVTAQGLTFDASTLDAPASQPFTLAFHNDDDGVPHNVAIYHDSSASRVLFKGEIVTGPKTIDYSIPALDAGNYFFRCDVHPQMNGRFTVTPVASPAASPSAGG